MSGVSSVSGILCDDCASGGISLGFSFVYCGTTYTSLAASSNGYLSLAGATTGGYPTYVNATTSISSIGSGVGLLWCFWDDNYGFSSTGLGWTSHAYYTTIGSSPNRVFIFEWKDWGHCCSSTTGHDNYQVRLYESSNIIEYWYGSHTITSASGTIGICNSTTDWKDLNDRSSSPSTDTSSFYTSLNPIPNSGQVYQWSPNCVGVSATATTPVCSGDSIHLSSTITYGTATSYHWSGPGGFSSTLANTALVGSTSATGSYTFTASNGSCADSITVDVTVDSLPVAAISGAAFICSGSSATININGTAGATVYYHLTGGSSSVGTLDGSGSLSFSTGVLTATGSTRNYVYHLDSVISGACPHRYTDSVVVGVDPNPRPIFGGTGVCIGSSITLHDSDAGGIWTIGSSSIASISTSGANVTITGVSVGSTVLSYTFATGCLTTLNFTVYPLPTAISGPSSVCIGSTINLTDTGSGTWTSGNTSIATVGAASGIVTGVSAGRAVITYTSAAGCIVTDTITVNPLPATITGPSAVCVGSAITLGSTTPSGTWTSGSSTIATVGSTSGVVTGASAGTVGITYTLTTGCYRTASVVVNPLPSAITGTTALCASGGTTTLACSTTGGVWSSSSTTVATVGSTTGVVTGRSPGTATISYTISATGCYTTVSVTVNPLPRPINGPSAVCVGSTISLSDSVTGGTWSSTTTSVATVGSTSGVVTGVSAGTTTITYFLGSGCTISKTITVNPLPAAITGTLATCETQGTTTAYDATSGGVWSSATPSIATIDPSSGVISGLSSGTATISYTLTATGCAVSANVTINPLPAAISGPTVVCEGLTVTMTDGGSGTWSSSNTSVATVGSTTGVVGGVASGTSTITYTLPTSCYVTQDVSVNPLPSSITGPSAVCAGSTITLADATSGGTWISGATATATVASTGDVYGVASGTVTITYQLGTGCQTTTSVLVNPLPNTIGGPTDVCLGARITLSETTTGGSWSSDAVSVATVSGTGVVTGATVGSTTISYILSATGCYVTHPVTVNSLPAAISGPSAVCVAATIGLSDGSGSWTSSNTGVATIGASSGVVTGVASGTTTITFTDGLGCFTTTPIVVNPLPNPIGGATSVCEGFTATITDGTGGGTWASSNTTYATVTSTTGVVTGVLAGTINMTYTVTSTGCYITAPFTVNTTPPAPTGPIDVCAAGSTITLSDASIGGSWSTSSSTLATVGASTGVVTGVGAGTVTVTYTLGSCFNTKSVIVRPLPGAIITPLGDTSLCPGDYVTFTANTGTGYVYQWYLGATPISGETDDYYVVSSAGNYKVSVTSGFGCNSISSPMSATYFTGTAGLTASSTSFCTGSSAALSCTTSGSGLTYQWTNSGVGIRGATNSTYNATVSGSYQVVVSNSAGCYMSSASITITANPAPPVSISALGSLAVCSGDSVTLVGDTSSSIISYSWQNSGGPIAGATNRTLVVGAPDTYRYIATNSYTCTATSANEIVTVYALPNSTVSAAGPTTFCAGGRVILSATSVAGATYQWYKNGTVITGATINSYTATTTGYYSVKVTSSTGCSSTTRTPVYVESITIPVITPYGTPAFCWGGRAELGVSVSSGATISYQWQYMGSNIPGATDRTYTTRIPGDYSCSVNVGGCATSSVSMHVIEYPVPNPVIFYDGRYLSTVNRFVSYQWFRNMIPVATTPRYIPTMTGDYTVRVVDTNGCQTISPIYTLRGGSNIAMTGVSNITPESVSIYPNPATDMVHIESDVRLNATICTMDGKTVITSSSNEINISSLAQGVYTISLYTEEGVLVKIEKLVKQ